MVKEKSKHRQIIKTGNRNRRILIIPAVKPGMGMGHLIRCFDLARSLSPHALIASIFIAQHDINLNPGLKNYLKQLDMTDQKKIIRQLPKQIEWFLIILDNRYAEIESIKSLAEKYPIIGLDQGGPCRPYLPYLIDTLSTLKQADNPNLKFFNILPYKHTIKRQTPSLYKKILISFGGEDQKDLSSRLLKSILNNKIFVPQNITLVQGPLFHTKKWPPGIKILKNPSNLPEIMPHYDLCFTHFGITALQALALRLPVILLNPTSYHRKLAKKLSIPEIGIIKPKIGRLKKILKDRPALLNPIKSIQQEQNKGSVVQFINQIQLQGNIKCPICNTYTNPAIARFNDRTYFRCSDCGLIYMQNFLGMSKNYDKDYFFSEYKRKYNKTYLDDFHHIKQLATTRLNIIKKLTKATNLLDIGCAYGPFLQAAAENGLKPIGCDISRVAVEYVKNQLKIPCSLIDFEHSKKLPFKTESFDIISMWFVIEHFIDLDFILKRCNRLLKPGGILAFSTPNGRGISAFKNKEDFLQHSPADHFTIFSPAVAQSILKKYGFRAKIIRITGHHGERFCSRFKELFCRISRLLGLGDTFEIYARKVKQI